MRSRQNYKIDACNGSIGQVTAPCSVVLHTAASSSFFKFARISLKLQRLNRLLEDHISVRDAHNRIVLIADTITSVVSVKNQTATNVAPNVVKRLRANVTIGCEFCGALLGAIRTLQWIVKPTDSTAVLINERLPTLSPNLVLILETQDFFAHTGCASHKTYLS